ncbi:MAG: diaminopimelate epimerase [Actinobacteria bacterium]|nr:diaminopimelate epimerase [Actinomycetota bacterium]
MKLSLTKHHGLGNDFLVAFADDLPTVGPDLATLAIELCDRRRGIGADGLLVVHPADGYTAQMVLYNADGSRAAMSGNGIRCFAQAVAARTGAAGPYEILTDSGPRRVELFVTDRPDTIEASVDMGEVARIDAPAGWNEIGCDDARPVMHLGVGNPHTVVAVDDVDEVDLLTLGRQVPDINLEIVEPCEDPTAIRMRVHERGAGITEACGTGACASAVAAVAWGIVPARASEITVQMDGGRARVRIDHPTSGRVTLIGPSVFVGTITVDLAQAVA